MTPKLLDIKPGWTESFRMTSDDFQMPRIRHRSVATQLTNIAKQDEANLFAILNPSKHNDVLMYLAYNEVKFQSLYMGTKQEKYFIASPILVRFKGYTRLLNFLVTDGWESSCCIWVTSRYEFQELANYIKKFNIVKDENGVSVLFRYFDPEILRVFLQSSKQDEAHFFMDKVTRFITVSPLGYLLNFEKKETSSYKNNAPSSNDSFKNKIFEMQDYHAYAFETYSKILFEKKAFNILKNEAHNLSLNLTDNEIITIISLGLFKASNYDIITDNGALIFLKYMLKFGKNFDTNPTIQWAIEILKNNKIGFFKRIQLLENHYNKSPIKEKKSANGNKL